MKKVYEKPLATAQGLELEGFLCASGDEKCPMDPDVEVNDMSEWTSEEALGTINL